MAQAKIYWNMGNYAAIEKLFQRSADWCNEREVWKLNVAHIMFMREKYLEAVSLYRPIIDQHDGSVGQHVNDCSRLLVA